MSVDSRGVPFNLLNVLNELNHREVIDKHTPSCCAGCVHKVIARQYRGRVLRQNLPARCDRKRLEKVPGSLEAAVGLQCPAALLAEPGGVMAAQ